MARSRVATSTLVLTLLVSTLSIAPGLAARPDRPDVPVPDPPRVNPAPPAQAESVDPALRDHQPPARPNHVEARNAAFITAFEQAGMEVGTKPTVIESRDGLFVVEFQEEGRRTRVAAFDMTTDGGDSVIGLAFLDEEEIAQLEAAEEGTSLFGPGVASAHRTDKSHYHYFFNCSWVYNQGGTYGITVHFCPQDYGDVQGAGWVIAGLMGITTGHPLLGWITGVIWNYGTGYCRDAAGNCRISMSDYRIISGAIYHGPALPNLFFYSIYSSLFGYARNQSTGSLYYVRIAGY